MGVSISPIEPIKFNRSFPLSPTFELALKQPTQGLPFSGHFKSHPLAVIGPKHNFPFSMRHPSLYNEHCSHIHLLTSFFSGSGDNKLNKYEIEAIILSVVGGQPGRKISTLIISLTLTI
ncbi:hypothetical protein ES703_65406 [subsurface metagenome]